jgi:putative nucleotidyltransferase with HDIG domain
MADNGNCFRTQLYRSLTVSSAIAAITLAHFLLARGGHGFHVIHIVLGGMYLLPIIAGAVWFRLRGAVASTVFASIAYCVHIRLSWANQPMENANQYAMIGVYWIVGVTAGMLVELQERERERRLRAEREAIIQGISGLSIALKFRDEYTREHSEHVSRLAVQIGSRIGLSAERLDLIRLAGLVHDIGKIGVRDDVLFKPHELSPEELQVIQQHPRIAAEILSPISGTKEVAKIVLAHHECPDGSGYPLGSKGEEIRVEARVVRVADVFCSLIEERPYKSSMQIDEALSVMRKMVGSKLDTKSFEALQTLIDDHSAIV